MKNHLKVTLLIFVLGLLKNNAFAQNTTLIDINAELRSLGYIIVFFVGMGFEILTALFNDSLKQV